MPLTLLDICDKLERLDEVTVLELLDIRSADIVAKFMDAIEDRADYLEEILDDNYEQQGNNDNR
jgi:hypothetical protein